MEACQVNEFPSSADGEKQGGSEIVVEVILPDLEKALRDVRPRGQSDARGLLSNPKGQMERH